MLIEPVDPTMTRDELIAAAESIGMRFPAPVAQGEPVAFVDLSACDCRNSVDDCDYPDCKAGRAAQAAHASAARCPYCDGTGDVHTPTGEWRGSCICEAGKAAPAPVAQCRDDGRCQYAIDHGAEGLAACPKGKCAMLPAPVTQGEPVVIVADNGPAYRAMVAALVKLPEGTKLYTHPAPAPVLTPAQSLTDEQAKRLLNQSDLLDMFLHMGWYSAPRKNFNENTLALIRTTERACAEAWGVELVEAASAAPAPVAQPADMREAPTVGAAYNMGAKGGPVNEAERLAFEAWMRGHCWALSAHWTGSQYVSDAEAGGDLDPRAMQTRRLWAAWRDRAALAAPAPAGEPVATYMGHRMTPDGTKEFWGYADNPMPEGTKLYTAPPAAARVPLTDEQINEVFHTARNAKMGSGDNSRHRLSVVEIARAIERAHGMLEREL